MKPLVIIAALSLTTATSLAAGLKETPDRPNDLTNALDGDANIAGTEEAINRSNIPMEGAVADTMGEALALDKATDTYETGRPLVVLKDGYDKIELNEATVGSLANAPVFGLDDREIGRVETAGRNADGRFEGVVVIEGDEPRRVRVEDTRMVGMRSANGDVRVYLDGSEPALASLPEAG